MARKPKNTRRIEQKRQKRRKRLERKRESGSLEPLILRSHGPGSSSEDSLAYGPPGVERMSEVLEEFVEPYLDQTRNVDDMRTLYNLGVMAWNIANLPEPKQASELESLLKKVSHTLGGADAEVREIVTSLIDRKKTKFAGNRRIIIGFDLRDTGSAYQLSVISTLEP